MDLSFSKIKNELKNYVTLAKKLKADEKAPKVSKILLCLAVGYFLLPIDIIPNFIPIIRHLDDVTIIPFPIFVAIMVVPKEVFCENYGQVFNKK
jgi:uncharacterized membrane protein YkvA (DUF1232 family)